MYPSGWPTCNPAPDGYGNISRTYFFGLLVSTDRSGVLNVLFSSQNFCHFGSTSANGYTVGDDGVELDVVVFVADPVEGSVVDDKCRRELLLL